MEYLALLNMGFLDFSERRFGSDNGAKRLIFLIMSKGGLYPRKRPALAGLSTIETMTAKK